MSAVHLNALVAVATAYGTSALFFPALRAHARVRLVVFVLLTTLVGLTPWMIPAEARIARFIAAVYAGVLVLKMWDLHLGAERSVRLRLAEFLGFLANLASMVHRRTGLERQPTPRDNAIALFKSLVLFSVALLAFILLVRLDWGSTPFLIEHVLKASVFFLGATALFKAVTAVARGLGGYATEPMFRPMLSRSPADFWRRYNRCAGEWLREDLFHPIGGRRHPVLAMLAVFVFSGLIHEYLFAAALGRVQGFQLAFFFVQGAAVALTLRVKPGREVGVGFTFVFNALTSIPFFASVHGVVPFYEAGIPAWLWGG
jgi:hypothetical protein